MDKKTEVVPAINGSPILYRLIKYTDLMVFAVNGVFRLYFTFEKFGQLILMVSSVTLTKIKKKDVTLFIVSDF